MADKEKTDFVCPECAAPVERQHWGIDEALTTYQDMLTCSDIKCDFHKIVRCVHKNLDQEKQN